MIEFKSKVSVSSSKFDSARVVIPSKLREMLNINPGDHVKWIVTINPDGIDVKFEKLEDE